MRLLFLVVLCFIPLFPGLRVKKFSHMSLVWVPDSVFINQNLRYILCDKTVQVIDEISQTQLEHVLFIYVL